MSQEVERPANVRPFLRWAGSKRKLLKHLLPLIPKTWEKYYEPFLGGGAMFFYLGPKRAVISDASGPLIDTYRAVRTDADGILKGLRPLKPDRTSFDRIRQASLRSPVSKAVQFVFLNKACWNGLFRVNADGIFNVPFGRPKTDFIIDEKNFRNCSTLLRRRSVSIQNQDFEAIADRVEENDFVFLDPPYVTSHNLNGFLDWNEAIFSWEDQIRLAAMARKLVWRGANVLVTNAAHADVCDLYAGFNRMTFERPSTLASDTSRRATTTEAIFTGGPAYGKLSARVSRRGAWHGSDRRVD